tara:strand:+ start:5462 stop:5830 length:369 start_codon:yes stop_codon:yes gene_type:complete
MTNEITLAKEQFRDALIAADLDCVEYIPERVIPPVVVINSGSAFLVPETLGNQYTMNLELVLIAGTATNETVTEELENLIQKVLRALPAYAVLQRVDRPFALAINNAEFYSTNVNVELSITI